MRRPRIWATRCEEGVTQAGLLAKQELVLRLTCSALLLPGGVLAASTATRWPL